MKNFIIIISLLFLNKKINALAFNNDSLKTKYELNDPRNPNCPCHKYQKLAEKEFKKMNGVGKYKFEKEKNSTLSSEKK